MKGETTTIKANKFHADTGFKYVDYSDKCIQLINGQSFSKFIPKSTCVNIFDLGKGTFEIHVERWILETKENKHFFKSIL